ncbi:acetyl-CoA synthetase-like protein [Xylaria sp. FL0043]|nr:acetyl-CoA synthetase-like protein [Xylaria sp. FL0043]
MADTRVSSAFWRDYPLPRIVDIMDHIAPDSIYGTWPVQQNSYAAGVRNITYAQLANIVNGLTWWLVEQLGPHKRNEVVAYVGPNDVRFTALVLAAMKTGHAVFLTSPRNSAIAHRKLLGSLKCETLISPDPTHATTRTILETVEPCRSLTIPSVDGLLCTKHTAYEVKMSLDRSLLDASFIIHTSGSTGIPKPLIWTQATTMRHIEASSRDPPDELTSIESLLHEKRILSTLPPFHGAGLLQHLLYAIPFGTIPVIPAAVGGTVTAQGVVDALKQTPADVAVMVPSIVAQLSECPELLDYCAKNLQLILYIGGDLPQPVGDRVASKIRLRCWWRASEVGMPQQLIVPELESQEGGWRYVRFHPCAGATFDKVDDNLYELVISRDETRIDTQTSFTIGGFEDFTEYRTRDLFEPHPTVPNSWRWRARNDDIIVFLNGEKTNPVSVEQHIVSHNPGLISGAIVIGNGKLEAGLIIEPAGNNGLLTMAEQASLIEQVWPSVEEANRSAPAHARIYKSLIMVASQPFVRAGKGTVQRGASVKQYTLGIGTLYAVNDVTSGVFGDGDEATIAQAVEMTDVTTLTRFIQETVGYKKVSEVDDNTNFFDAGMDSLQALQLMRAIRKIVHCSNINLSCVYENPTARQLATAVLSNSDRDPEDPKTLEELLSTYKGHLQDVSVRFITPGIEEEGPFDILLTGSTGTLGTSILHALLKNPDVHHVFCLNRHRDGGREAQLKSFTASHIGPEILDNRVTFLYADLTSPLLSLDIETYKLLLCRVNLIIHNAWPVNFNLKLLAFRSMFAGLVKIFDFVALASPRIIRTFFMSSVSAMFYMGPDAPQEAVPDQLKSLSVPLGNGYVGSKRLAELLCDSAARYCKVPVTILRIGQVAGSTTAGGATWNRSEWLPSLIISSMLRLKCLPDSLGPLFSDIDWVPSDLLGEIVADLVLATPDTPKGDHAMVFNVRNPNTTSWSSLIPAIKEVAKTRFNETLQVVSPMAWLSKLLQSVESDANEAGIELTASLVARNPALKLVDFYNETLWSCSLEDRQLPMVVTRAMASSKTLRSVPAASPQLMRKWVDEWMDDVGPSRNQMLLTIRTRGFDKGLT